ncbi:hypothetical protein MUP77_18180 [Candidatus Bathyarchaeota archaeon]|nr:hypothetical protein [Candidatus Bathyarchaeota archaeon]
MGKRLENWLSKASTTGTKKDWKGRWLKFATWITTEKNPLTGTPYLSCKPEEVDDKIRADFESLPSHLFQDRWRDILTKYVAYLNTSEVKPNTAASRITSVRSFFSNEASSIPMQKGKLPTPEMAMNEHRFNITEFRKMWLVANLEGKARLSVAVSLGWGIGDFLDLKTPFIKNVLGTVDSDGFVYFDSRRQKTKARTRGILTPTAVHDLTAYLKTIPSTQEYVWTTRTDIGLNYWLKTLYKDAGLQENGQVRFHLIRKDTFDIVSSQCGLYEAKLLVGKSIPLEDATYLHGMEDRLLEKYKKFAYPFLQLNGTMETPTGRMEDLEKKIDALHTTVATLSKRNTELEETLTNTENAFSKTVDKLLKRLERVEVELQVEREPAVPTVVFEAPEKKTS